MVPPPWPAGPEGCMTPLMRGWGRDMEAGMPIAGIMAPMGASGAMGTMVTGPTEGIEERGMGSALRWDRPPKPGMGLTRIWLRVGGCGWFTWKGFWRAGDGAGAGAAPPPPPPPPPLPPAQTDRQTDRQTDSQLYHLHHYNRFNLLNQLSN